MALIYFTKGSPKRPRARDRVADVWVIIDADVYVRFPHPMEPGLLVGQFRESPTMLSRDYSRVDTIKIVTFLPAPADVGFDPNPIAIPNS